MSIYQVDDAPFIFPTSLYSFTSPFHLHQISIALHHSTRSIFCISLIHSGRDNPRQCLQLQGIPRDRPLRRLTPRLSRKSRQELSAKAQWIQLQRRNEKRKRSMNAPTRTNRPKLRSQRNRRKPPHQPTVSNSPWGIRPNLIIQRA